MDIDKNKKIIFGLAFPVWILLVILIFLVGILIKLTFSSPMLIIETVLVGFCTVVWVLYIFTSARVVIKSDSILFPKQYKLNATTVLSGTTFLSGLFNKRRWIKPAEVFSVDIIVGYSSEAGIDSIHQPLILTFTDGSAAVFYMKLFSKRFVINLLKNMRDMNPNISFSVSSQELMGLKTPFTLTATEKRYAKPLKKLLLGLVLFTIIFFAALYIVRTTGDSVTKEYDITSFYEGYYGHDKVMFIETSQGDKFIVSIDGFESKAENFLKVLENNMQLLNNAKITYINRLGGIVKNVTFIKLSDGESLTTK